MHYSRSDCARILGISMDTLRYYESIGIVTPGRKKDTGRIVYTEKEILALLGFMKTKSFGYSNSELAAVFIAHTNDAGFTDTISRLERQIRQLSELCAYLRGIGGNLYDDFRRNAGRVSIRELPQRDFLLFEPKNERWIAKATQGFPYLNFGYWIDRRCLTGELPWNVRLGVDICPLRIPHPQLYEELIHSGCVHSNGSGIKISLNKVCHQLEDIRPESFEPMAAYARAHCFHLNGDVFGGILTRDSFIYRQNGEFIVTQTIQLSESPSATEALRD